MSEQNKPLVRRYFEELDRGKAAPEKQANVGARSRS